MERWLIPRASLRVLEHTQDASFKMRVLIRTQEDGGEEKIIFTFPFLSFLKSFFGKGCSYFVVYINMPGKMQGVFIVTLSFEDLLTKENFLPDP